MARCSSLCGTGRYSLSAWPTVWLALACKGKHCRTDTSLEFVCNLILDVENKIGQTAILYHLQTILCPQRYKLLHWDITEATTKKRKFFVTIKAVKLCDELTRWSHLFSGDVTVKRQVSFKVIVCRKLVKPSKKNKMHRSTWSNHFLCDCLSHCFWLTQLLIEVN